MERRKRLTGATAFLDCRRDELRTPLSGAGSDPRFRCGKIHGLDHWVIECESWEKVEWSRVREARHQYLMMACGPRRVCPEDKRWFRLRLHKGWLMGECALV
jgi:hypothetical protein